MWKPIDCKEDLPIIRTRETANLDFKSQLGDDFDIAKDVAAFANASGGTLLIGGAGGDQLDHWLPVTEQEVQKMMSYSDVAVRDRCRPAPIFSLEKIPIDSGFVLSINVWPFPGQPVGVLIKKGETKCGKREREVDNLYLLPIRVGTHTRAICPEQIAMFMDARARRIAMCLEEAINTESLFIATKYRSENANWYTRGTVISVDILRSTVMVKVPFSKESHVIPVPLDAFESACFSTECWRFYVGGIFKLLDVMSTAPDIYQSVPAYFDARG